MTTTEEAIKTLKENCCAMCAYGSQDMDSCDIRGCDNRDAIKALEQEPILDKIRAEIERLHYHPKLDFIKNDDVVDMTLDVIDKYRAEQGGRVNGKINTNNFRGYGRTTRKVRLYWNFRSNRRFVSELQNYDSKRRTADCGKVTERAKRNKGVNRCIA